MASAGSVRVVHASPDHHEAVRSGGRQRGSHGTREKSLFGCRRAVIGNRCGRGSGAPVLLRLIDERSIAFRAAVMSAPGLELQVPTCPEWTLLDLAQHLGAVHRKWAATVNAGPAAA